jgi:hypothetical protein
VDFVDSDYGILEIDILKSVLVRGNFESISKLCLTIPLFRLMSKEKKRNRLVPAGHRNASPNKMQALRSSTRYSESERTHSEQQSGIQGDVSPNKTGMQLRPRLQAADKNLFVKPAGPIESKLERKRRMDRERQNKHRGLPLGNKRPVGSQQQGKTGLRNKENTYIRNKTHTLGIKQESAGEKEKQKRSGGSCKKTLGRY